MADFTKDLSINAYHIDTLGDVKPRIVIGGKSPKFVPNLNISFDCASGKEKYYINLNRKAVKVDEEKESHVDGKISLPIGAQTDIWHIDEHGRLNWDIDFEQKPSTNVFEWELTCSEGLSFHYQPALTKQEIEKHSVRPDDVVGSYAVYCDKAGHYRDASGKTLENYTTGKLLHIYRPLCRDAAGKTEWADLNIADGKLTVTIPQKYLDAAQYPVTLDPTFGITARGATEGETACSVSWPISGLSPSGGGTLTNISIWTTASTDPGPSLYFAFYSDSSGPASRLAYDGASFSTGPNASPHLVTNPVAWSYALPASAAQYHGAAFRVEGTSSAGSPPDHFYYDNGGGKTNSYSDGFMAPPATISGWSTDYSDKYFSLYATYEVAGAAAGGIPPHLLTPQRSFQHMLVR